MDSQKTVQERSTDRESMPRERDEESGRFVESYPPEAFLEALRDEAPFPISTPDVAEELGCSLVLARDRLSDLNEEGAVEKRRVGNAYLWAIKEDTEN